MRICSKCYCAVDFPFCYCLILFFSLVSLSRVWVLVSCFVRVGWGQGGEGERYTRSMTNGEWRTLNCAGAFFL